MYKIADYYTALQREDGVWTWKAVTLEVSAVCRWRAIKIVNYSASDVRGYGPKLSATRVVF